MIAPTHPQLKVQNRKNGAPKIYYLDQDRVLLGRDLSNYVVLDDRTVSRKHAEILAEGSQYFVRDLGSNNGTILNETPLAPKEKSLLRSGDKIRIEDFDIFFELPSLKNQARDQEGEKLPQDLYEVTDSDLLEVKMVKKLLRAMDKESAPSLEVLDGTETGKRFVFEDKNQDVVVGRDPACEFMVDSGVISRKHAKFEKRYDTVIVKDLDSKNGTFVNRERIREKKLQDGDVVHLGTLTLSFKNPQELSFDFEPPVETLPTPQASETSPSPEVSSSNLRASRRKGPEETPQEPALEVLEEAPVPVEAMEPVSPQESSEEPLLEGENVPSPLAKYLPAALAHFSTMELVTGVAGALVLIAALWGIIKIF